MPINLRFRRVYPLTLWVLVIFAVPQSLLAAGQASSPIGRLITSGSVSIGGVTAPTGTAVFSGELIVTQESPALITFREGSRILMIQDTAATFSRSGKALVIHADRGVIDFNFLPGEVASIQAGTYRFTTSGQGRTNAGELELSADGQVAISLSSGSLSAADTASGKSVEIQPTSDGPPTQGYPSLSASVEQIILTEIGEGTLTRDGSTFTALTASWPVDGFIGYRIEVNGESHKIISNTSTTLTIDDTWDLPTGTYGYRIAKGGMSTGTKAVLGAAAGGGAVGAIVIATRGSKSPG